MGKSLCKGKSVKNPNKCKKVRGCKVPNVVFAEKLRMARKKIVNRIKLKRKDDK